MQIMGSFYNRNGRWYWRVRLPGQAKATTMACIPKGHTNATPDRAVAEQFARSYLRRHATQDTPVCRTLNDLCGLYQTWSNSYYPPHSQAEKPAAAFPLLMHLFGHLPPEDFGPKRLKRLQQAYVKQGTLCRRSINHHVGLIKRMFKWAVSEELLDVSVYNALQTVPGLRQGRTPAQDYPPRKPAAWADVEAVLPFMTPVIAAMVHLGWLTGMRPSEICQMTPAQIDRTGPLWIYQPARHKTRYRGQSRDIFLGPRAQAVLTPFLDRPADRPCFSPTESEAIRYGFPRGRTGDRYDYHAFARAVKYAQQQAQKVEDANAAAASKAAMKQIEPVMIVKWSPYQLRHAKAAAAAAKYG